MKTRIKMRVTPEQSKQVQEIVFSNGGKWRWLNTEVRNTDKETLFIDEEKTISHQFDNIEYFNEHEYLEVDPDIFIKTNGTCELGNTKPKYKVGDIIESSLRTLTIKEIKKENNKYRYVALEDGEIKDFTFSEDYLERYFVLKDTSTGDPIIEKDNATNPNHYNQMKIQPNEYITANYECFSWNTANVIKYTSRYKSKNGIEDLEKAIKYLQFEIEELRKAEQ